jgi:hypothetical protein
MASDLGTRSEGHSCSGPSPNIEPWPCPALTWIKACVASLRPIADVRLCSVHPTVLERGLVGEAKHRATAHRGSVATVFLHGTVHEAREDFQAAVQLDPTVLSLWEGLTPLGRNEFICWVDDAKQPVTRQRRIRRTCEELLEGRKRPCCWAGCIHRTDKAPSAWQQAVSIERKRKNGA